VRRAFGRINEPAAWERAKRVAREALDGNFWLNDVGKATHPIAGRACAFRAP